MMTLIFFIKILEKMFDTVLITVCFFIMYKYFSIKFITTGQFKKVKLSANTPASSVLLIRIRICLEPNLYVGSESGSSNKNMKYICLNLTNQSNVFIV